MTAALENPSSNSRLPRSKTRDLRFHLLIRASPDKVYRGLTSACELCRWWLQGAETDARNMGRLRLVWPRIKAESGGAFPPHVAVRESEGYFVDLEPGRKVAWIWKLPRRRSPVPPLSTFFIRPRGRGSELTLVHAGFSSHPRADRYYQGCAQGWEDCLAKIKLYLETGRTCKSQALRLSDLPRLRKAR